MKTIVLFSLFFCLNFYPTTSLRKIVPRRNSTRNISGGRIIGGQTANPAQFTHAAAIYVQNPTSRYFCSGSLLSNQWILTAGQCVDGATLFQIVLGSVHLSGGSEQIEVATSSYVLHPDYNPLTLENDIGLIQLRLPITLTNYIQPFQRLSLAELPDYVTATIFGWGQTSDEDAGLSDAMQWVRVISLSNAECALTYGSQIVDTMLCVEGNLNEGTCYGDIGSTLVQYFASGQPFPVGIASFVSFNGCESTDPSGFTRTYPYNAWIRNVTQLDI
ncbi:hypothetical protein Zmor_015428 [Zophobas morio]|uniref:Peptidase S1 domain-containing protein n=1 Tax=Zophobas morio TaxID=2755281 RepID=A0AA38IK93_9CUCU|nr:hypothetical protein Zmor_015428 [Zophobas morio]